MGRESNQRRKRREQTRCRQMDNTNINVFSEMICYKGNNQMMFFQQQK